jgi:hypothetical protein
MLYAKEVPASPGVNWHEIKLEFPSYVRQTALRFLHSARVSDAPAALSDVRCVNSAPIN